VIGQQIVDFSCLFVITKIDSAPFEILWKSNFFGLHVSNSFDLDRLVELVAMVAFEVLWHWLCVPEVMLIEQGDSFAELFELPVCVTLHCLCL